MICNSKILAWPQLELKEYRMLDEKLIGVTGFESLKTLTKVIKNLCKDTPQVKFVPTFQDNVLGLLCC